jgi:hypothetical protein
MRGANEMRKSALKRAHVVSTAGVEFSPKHARVPAALYEAVASTYAPEMDIGCSMAGEGEISE